MGRKQDRGLIRPQAAEDKRTRDLLALALLIVSVFFAYSNSLTGTWAMDDTVANRPVGMKDISDLLGYRKITYLTFLLNQYIAPFSPANFRLVNIFIHIVNSVLVYALAYRTVIMRVSDPGQYGKTAGTKKEGTRAVYEKKAFCIALLSGIVFALHPLNINAVAYVVQRMTALATMFILLSLHCYISASRSKSGARPLTLYVLSALFLILGIFSKENAVMGVPLILLYEYIFLLNFSRGEFLRRTLAIVGIGSVSIGLASYLLKFQYALVETGRFLFHPNSPLTERAWMAVDVYWTPLQHILTEFRVVSRYIFLIFLPLPRFLVFDWWGFPVSQGIIEPVTTLLSIAFVLALLSFSIWKIRRFPLLSFGILWYLIAISLESFFGLGTDLYFEHRNYLPLSGLVMGIVGQTVLALKRELNAKVVWSAAIMLCIVLGSLTFSRNIMWKDSLTFWRDSLKKNPSNIRAVMAMGNASLMLSDGEKAERYYKNALMLSSKDKRLHFLNESAYSLGMLYLFEGRTQQAKELIDRFYSLIESNKAKILRGFFKALDGDAEGALKDYQEIIGQTEGIDTVVTLVLMGDGYRETGLWDNAIEQYTKAISLDPGFSAAYYGLGASYLGKRNLALADDYFDKTLSIDPNNVLALSDKADILLIKKANPEEALMYARKAVSKSPFLYQSYLTMANVLIVLGRDGEADKYYNKALERSMRSYMVPFSKARAYYLRGDAERAQYYLSELRSYKDLPEKIKDIVRIR